MTMAAPPAPPAAPFIMGTRFVPQLTKSQAFTLGGGVVDVELDRVGYGDMVILHLYGTVTGANATLVYKAGAPFNALSRIVLDTPGLADPIAVSGDSLHEQNLAGMDFVLGHYTMVDSPAQGTLDANAYDAATLVNLAPGAVGANTWHLWYVLPFARNASDKRGLVPLGNTGRSRVRVTPAAVADLVTVPANLASSSLTLDVFQVFATAPPAGVESPDTSWAVILDEYTQNITAVGDQKIVIPTEGRILNIIHRVFLNDAANSADIQDLTLQLNRDRLLDKAPHDLWAFIQRRRRRHPFRVGTIAYDFDYRAQSDRFIVPGEGERGPEWINSDGLVDLFSIPAIKSTATLGSVAKVVTTVRRLKRVQ